MAEQVGSTPMQVMLSLLHTNGYVFEYTTDGVSNKLENLFFVHPKSIEIWRAFPHVLIMDATYKTNVYNMPFVEIVGVTSTSKTFCIAFAFVHNEKGVTYKWVLECLKLTLDECMHPRVIVIDRDFALMNACQEVFLGARLLCRYHIRTNIFRYCKSYFRTLHDCGYRALAVCIGLNEDDYFEYIRQQIKEELQNRFDIYTKMFQIDTNLLYDSLCFIGSPCPIQYWMSMPAAGVLIANKLDVVVHFLSKSGSSTIFPFWKGPQECQHHRALTIALVNDDHYVMVQLEGEYPMPIITPYWNSRYISSSVAVWEIMYRPRLELFTQLCPRKRVFVDVSD